MEIPDFLTKPQFWDYFGLPVFLYITTLAIYLLWKKELPKNKKYIWALLIIGILGLIVDGTIVIFGEKTFSLIG